VAESIVVNAGPLIALARAGALDIVGRLLITYVCPMQVRTELDEGARSGYLDIRVPWLEVVPLTTPLDAVSMATLDAGEAAVIQWRASAALSGCASTTERDAGRRWPLVFGSQAHSGYSFEQRSSDLYPPFVLSSNAP
jgi:hypothetical protein